MSSFSELPQIRGGMTSKSQDNKQNILIDKFDHPWIDWHKSLLNQIYIEKTQRDLLEHIPDVNAWLQEMMKVIQDGSTEVNIELTELLDILMKIMHIKKKTHILISDKQTAIKMIIRCHKLLKARNDAIQILWYNKNREEIMNVIVKEMNKN